MQTFSESLKFQGVWRPYQARVLANLKDYKLMDNKIHIVAPPGSGKTVLGLEIIRRLDKPALVLAPSIAIREQWRERFIEMFCSSETEGYITTSLSRPAPITVLTYQALHTYLKGNPQGAESLFCSLGIQTLVLDEAHHLRNEWYKALRELSRHFTQTVTVSLTATPPYDVPLNEWQRYIQLCGEIDEEILVTELVQEENLCPHQDYVYFNFPTPAEIKTLKDTRQRLADYLDTLSQDPALIQAILCHPALANSAQHLEAILSSPGYFTSLLVLLHNARCSVPREVLSLIGNRASLPKLSHLWLERALQGFLFDDEKSYSGFGQLQGRLKQELAAFGACQRRRVNLTNIPALSKLIVTSSAKLASIQAITEAELAALGQELRLVILTDFIKKTADISGELREIGTLPIFEQLRRGKLAGLRPAILSGTYILIPQTAQPQLLSLAQTLNIQVSYSPSRFPEYLEVSFTGASRSRMVAAITQLFSQGEINTLIGTAALLGEGWDAPCINSLILASYIGSYMLSNQMRGRAIRVDRYNPQKTANVWHLVTMEPIWAYETNALKQLQVYNYASAQNQRCPVSDDYLTLTRRFKAFIGVGYTENVIENGLDRLCLIRPPYTRENIANINNLMIQAAQDRPRLRERWLQCLATSQGAINPLEVTTADNRLTARSYVFRNALGAMMSAAALSSFSVGVYRLPAEDAFSAILTLIALGFLILAGVYLNKAITNFYYSISPARNLRQMGKALLSALQVQELIESANIRVISQRIDPFTSTCALEGGTTLEKRLFADCLQELLGVIDNPRYMLKSSRSYLFRHAEYYSVPEVLGRNKESAQIFHAIFQKHLGPFDLIYTRTAQGRKELLRARAKSFVNKNALLLEGKTKLQSKWQ